MGAASIIDRSGGNQGLDVPYPSLAQVALPTYQPEACPLCAAGSAGRQARLARVTTSEAADDSVRACSRGRRRGAVVMRTLKLTLAYDGTRFVGWQRQAEGDSVQGLLEDALARFEGAPVTVHGAGRTDAGVHALGQVASVQRHLRRTTSRRWRARSTPSCPRTSACVAVEEAAAGFHARFSARRRPTAT